jgi:PAS domain S-box-containing protein
MFAMLETLPAMICLLNPDHYVTFANRAFRERFGVSNGRRCYEYCFGHSVPCHFCKSYDALTTGQPQHWELRLPDGSVIEAYDFPFKDSDGSPLILEMDIDVTELKRAEAARALAAIVESSEDAIVSKDLAGVIQSWNRGAERLYGYPAAEMVGRSMAILLPEDRGEEVDHILERIRSAEPVEAYETARVTKGGRLIHVSLTASPVLDPAGQLTGVSMVARDITRRKQAEDALRQSLDRLQRVLEVETVGVMFWDLNTGCMVDANDAFLKLMGYSRSQVDARELTWQNLTPPEYMDVSRAEVEKFLATGRVGPYEKEYFRKDGTKRWLLFAGSSLGGHQCVEFCIDISDRKRMEGELRESEEQFRTLANAIPTLCWTARADGWIFWYNQRWYDYTGTTPEQMEGWGWQSVHDPGALPKVLERWKASIATGEPFDMVFPLRGVHGSFRSFLTRVVPVRDRDGRVTKWFGTNTDISELQTAQEALRRSEAELREAQRIAHLGSWTLQAATDSATWSDEIYSIFGRDPALPAAGIADSETLFSSESFSRLKTAVRAGVESGTPYELDLEVPGPDGARRWITARGEPQRDSAGRVVALRGTILDITERKRAEDEVRQLNASLERRVAERTAELATANQELEAFTYSVAHDLRAPLRGLDGFSLALLEDYDSALDDMGREYLGRIRSAASRMGQLIEDLLNLSRISRTELHTETVSISDLAVSVSSELQMASPERKGQFVIARSLQVDGDPHLLRVVLVNLLGNAWKFTAKLDTAKIELGTLAKDGREVYFVRDNGAGFDMQYAAKLFAPFQRLHSTADFPGTGIGLASAARIVHKHGGEIWAEAEINKGATFYFTLQRTGSSQLIYGRKNCPLVIVNS